MPVSQPPPLAQDNVHVAQAFLNPLGDGMNLAVGVSGAQDKIIAKIGDRPHVQNSNGLGLLIGSKRRDLFG